MTQNNITIPTIEAINEILLPIVKSLNDIKSKIENKNPPKKYYRNKDLKQIFGLSDNTIITYRSKNIIPYTFIGELYYYPVDELEKMLKQNSNHP